MEDYRTAGIVRECLIRQVPEASDLHMKLARLHTVPAIRQRVERYCRRLHAYAQDPAGPAEARAEASRRAHLLRLHLEVLTDCLSHEPPPGWTGEPADTPSPAADGVSDSGRSAGGHAGTAGVIDLDAARAARGRGA